MLRRLKKKFEKVANDQFNNGCRFIKTIQFIKNLILNWDQRNNLLTMKYFLQRWNDKVKKMKARELTLEIL